MKYAFCFSLIFCFTLGSFSVAGAQAVKHKVTPRVIDREVDQRDILTEIITIENFATHKITVFPSVNEVVVDEGGDIGDFVAPSMSDGAVTVTNWIEITRQGLELVPGEKREIPLKIKINPQAEAGVYHALIGFGSGRNRDIAEAQVINGSAPSVILTLSVDQNKVASLKLDRFIIDTFVTTADNEAIAYTLANPSEVPVVPTGEIIVSNSRGEEVSAVVINPEGITLAPGEEQTFVAQAPAAGLFGKHKALLSADFGTSQVASVYDTAFFYVVPWMQLVIGFVLLLVIACGLTALVHRRLHATTGDEHDIHYVPVFLRHKEVSDEMDHDLDLSDRT